MNFDVKQFSSDKILKHLDRVNEWLMGKNPPPITVELDLTNKCNHRCPECVCSYFRIANHDTLPDDMIDDIIRQIAEFGVRGLIFTGGGEPLLHPRAIDAVKLAHSLGIDLGFITNGSIMDKEIAKVLVSSVTWIRISLDAASPEVFRITHNMGEEEFEKVLKNIRILVEAKKKNNSQATIGVGFLTCEESRRDMYNAALLCRDLGVDYLQFRPMQIRRKGGFDYQWADVYDEITRLLPIGNSNFQILFSKHKYDMMKRKDYGRDYKICYGHQFATVIAADAKMYICCHTRGFDKYCIGDLRKNTLKEIWNSEHRQEVARNIDFKDCIPLCRDNTFNQILWNIKQPAVHKNFL